LRSFLLCAPSKKDRHSVSVFLDGAPDMGNNWVVQDHYALGSGKR
jgi:hypothetical protein